MPSADPGRAPHAAGTRLRREFVEMARTTITTDEHGIIVAAVDEQLRDSGEWIVTSRKRYVIAPR